MYLGKFKYRFKDCPNHDFSIKTPKGNLQCSNCGQVKAMKGSVKAKPVKKGVKSNVDNRISQKGGSYREKDFKQSRSSAADIKSSISSVIDSLNKKPVQPKGELHRLTEIIQKDPSNINQAKLHNYVKRRYKNLPTNKKPSQVLAEQEETKRIDALIAERLSNQHKKERKQKEGSN